MKHHWERTALRKSIIVLLIVQLFLSAGLLSCGFSDGTISGETTDSEDKVTSTTSEKTTDSGRKKDESDPGDNESVESRSATEETADDESEEKSSSEEKTASDDPEKKSSSEEETTPVGEKDDEPDDGTEKNTEKDTEQAATTPEPAEDRPLQTSDFLGYYVGDLNSVIFFNGDGTCIYSEPTNKNDLRLREGVDCRYFLTGSRLSIIDAFPYEIYSDPEDADTLLFYGKSERWKPEEFSSGRKVPEKAEEEDCYILPSSDRELTDFDLDALTRQQIRLGRNEILAKHGRLFDDKEIQRYFNGKTWYKGSVKTETFDKNLYSRLTELEGRNLDFINDYERKHG